MTEERSELTSQQDEPVQLENLFLEDQQRVQKILTEEIQKCLNLLDETQDRILALQKRGSHLQEYFVLPPDRDWETLLNFFC